MITPGDLLTALTDSIRSSEALKGVPVAAYNEEFQPPAANVQEVLDKLTWPNALLVYEGFDTGAQGWRHRFAMHLVTKNQIQAFTLVAGLLNNPTEGSGGLPWNVAEVTELCDPPSEIVFAPEIGDDGNERWILRFALQEKGFPAL